MITMYPVSDESLIDEEAEKIVETIKDFAIAVRALRAEYSVPPSQPVDVTILFGDAATHELVKTYESTLRTAVKIGALHLGAGGAPPAGTVVSVVGGSQVCVHLKGQIDVAAEQARIERDLAKTDKERGGIAGRLGNAAFVDKAPAAVVDKEREKLAELDERRARLKESLQRLGALA